MSKLTRYRRAAVVFSLVGAAVWSTTAGCSSKNQADNTPGLDGGQICPATVKLALGDENACHEEGKVCAIGYACGQFLSQQARCECTGGVFACTDSFGKPLTDPDHLPCTSPGGGNDKDCPASESAADQQSCKTPGLQCFYKGATCPGTGVANTDVCECVGAAGGDGGSLEFKCEPKQCNPPSDGGVVIIPLDAGRDG